MSGRINGLLVVWAVLATVAAAWLFGRLDAERSKAQAHVSAAPAPMIQTVVAPTPKTAAPAPVPYPQYVSTIPSAFRGAWDEMIGDGCAGREPRFVLDRRDFYNFEVKWEVTGVKLYSATEIDVHTTMKDENANQVDNVWQFKLVDGGQSLTSRKAGPSFFKRCPSSKSG